ncbi:NAD(P)H-dependent glycerol-3-phosphate dehydrogenase [Parvularcula marina]|uniref:Glycerol-3-phosphate dehydrogenase [NAD(P)+] n=1 Tax=Parvularcula marina TaxID=2292771 RepID=A0A371RIF7_9PROT|nr:NAD(P)H-dependent glycerol-3-phosphate dehydrogenase [Parvularcula marina]RFB05218.1 NAD(P)-dependent glycerol-3-phosphate dehydrogenase [Parvularcula marina]
MTAKPYEHCFVAGAGAWGTALAALLAGAGRKVTLWTRNDAVAAQINDARENKDYLAGIPLPEGITAVTDHGALAGADAMLCVIPAQHIRAQLPAFREAAPDNALPLALCSKGIEQSTGRAVHQVVEEIWPEAGAGVLSGPSFAHDVARGLPAAVTFADKDKARGERWLVTLATPTFRPYLSDDVIGAELGGAIKNVLAIACGMVEGAGLGNSARAALMARGFAETVRFAVAKGARPETLNGLSGLGDIILTCSSQQSRNFSLGYEIGQGRAVADILKERRTVAEGAATAPILVRLAKEAGVEMPIAEGVATLIEGHKPLSSVVEELLTRPLKSEN